MKKTILSLLTTALTISALASHAKNDADSNAHPQTYVLVHGAWQAPYVWDAVRTDLENKGNKVIVVQLPGHGTDRTPPQNLSLEIYSNKVIETIAGVDGKVILVGHSMGGMVITQVAEKIPLKIRNWFISGPFFLHQDRGLPTWPLPTRIQNWARCWFPLPTS